MNTYLRMKSKKKKIKSRFAVSCKRLGTPWKWPIVTSTLVFRRSTALDTRQNKLTLMLKHVCVIYPYNPRLLRKGVYRALEAYMYPSI